MRYIMKKSVKVGLIGFGTVGTGVVKLLKHNAEIISRKAGIPVELVKICDIDTKRDRGVKLSKGVLTSKIGEIVDNPDIDIIVELMGGYRPALDFILRALKNRKSVVTANKKLLAKHWDDVALAANEHGMEVMAEASVGGGIPVLMGVDKGLAANRIEKIMAILNGTCNYILTKMTVEKMSFSDALKEAQAKGFAEADPTLDIEGFDTMHKLVVLANLGFGKKVDEKDVYVEGIKHVDYMDIQYADEFGYVMKLLAIGEKEGNELNCRVHPVLVSKSHLLASVNYEFNAIHLRGDAVGDVMFYGRGAGEMPTASAVVADIIYIAKNIAHGVKRNPYHTGKGKNIKMKDIGDVAGKYYIRFNVLDRAGVLAKIAGALGKYGISIKSVIQKSRHSKEKVPVVITTYEACEASLKKALAAIDRMKIVKAKTVVYRIVE
jgi:homoserine dehydrogenase